MAPSAWACRTPNARLSRYGRLRVPAPLLPPLPTTALESASGRRCVRSASVQSAGKLSAFRGEYQLGRSPLSVLLQPAGRRTDVSKLAQPESRRSAEKTHYLLASAFRSLTSR